MVNSVVNFGDRVLVDRVICLSHDLCNELVQLLLVRLEADVNIIEKRLGR